MDNLCKGQWQLERWMKCDICVCMHRRKLDASRAYTHIYMCMYIDSLGKCKVATLFCRTTNQFLRTDDLDSWVTTILIVWWSAQICKLLLV